MKSTLAIALALALTLPPLAVSAQSGFVFGQPPTFTDAPRALAIFDHVEGYADVTSDRHGTASQPIANEFGVDLLMRMFRNICLGIEQGAALADVMPEGFAPYVTLPYSFGDIEAPDYSPGRRVLSSTGSIDADEDNGHPFIWLAPEATGMVCRVEWHMGEELPQDTQAFMTSYFDRWVPWSFVLVHASRPYLGITPPPSNVTEWDRPCGDRWCPMVILYSFSSGRITVETVLNITDVQGTQP